MKKLLFLFACLSVFAVTSCEKEVIMVKTMTIECAENILYYDSEAPVLTVKFDPTNAADQVLTWKSSKTDLITVDAEGKLTIVKFQYGGEVTITATNAASVKTATCDLIMAIKKANIEDYGIVETKGYTFDSEKYTLTFDILDRNIGATKTYDHEGTPESNKASIGDFFQFGNSIPVGTVDGLNDYYNKESNGGDLDWLDAKNTPCPEGWRMPNAAETKLLADATCTFYMYAPEYIEIANAFAAKVMIPKTGQYIIKGDTKEERAANTPELYLSSAHYLWSGEETLESESKRGFKQASSYENNDFSLRTKGAEVNTARPIRCIK